MATCSAGGVSITCGCGCYVICESDAPHRCWYGCEDCPVKVTIGGAVLETDSSPTLGMVGKGTRKLARVAGVSVQTNGMSLAGLARAFERICDGEVLVPVGRLDEEVSTTLSGPLEQVARTLGLAIAPTRSRTSSRRKTSASRS